MAKMDEVQTMATLSLARQQQADMRVDGVEQTANEAKALATGAAAGEPAGHVDLAGLAGWAPKALSVWKTTAGGGSCAVCVPDGCVSYAGSTVPASKFNPGVETKLGLQYCSIPPAEGDQGGKLFLTVTVLTSGDSEGEVDGVYIEWAASESAARSAHSSGSVDIVACVLLVETVNGELQQRHTGNIILGTTRVKPDEVSTEFREADGKLQIEGWDSGTPVSETSLADDLANDDEPASGLIVCRNEDGELEYKPIGTGPCRVTSVSNGSVNVEVANDLNGLEQTAHVTVPYSRAGGCEDGSFNIPVYAPPKRDDAPSTSSALQLSVVTDVYYAADPTDSNTYKFYKKYRTLTISGRGVIKKVSAESTAVFAETIKHSDVYGS